MPERIPNQQAAIWAEEELPAREPEAAPVDAEPKPEQGLLRLERVMHDGAKVKASASGASFHREATLRTHLEAAQERVRAMGDPRQQGGSQRTAAARKRAAREKVAKLQQALQEIQQVQAAGGGRSSLSHGPARPIRNRA